MGGAAPNTPARGFQIPWTPFIGFQGPPVVGIETPRWSFFLTWRRPANFCPARDPFIRTWHGPCGTMAGNPGGLVGPPPPSATSPGRRVALSSTFLKHPKRVCTWYRPSFCPDYGGSGDGGGETRLRPAPFRTWISPDRPYPPGPGRRPPAYPSGRPVNSQFGSQKGKALANWSAGTRRAARGNDDSAPLVLVLSPRSQHRQDRERGRP